MGQAKAKQRDCPAVGHRISAAECGENRASRYACPPDCPHNPWSPSNYDRALEIDTELTRKMMRRLAAEGLEQTDLPHTDGPEANLHWFFVGKFFRERDAAGETFVERWAKQQWQGLNNDERVLLGWTSRVRVAVIEVQEVFNHEQCAVVDQLDPSPVRLLIQDRNMAAMAVRFSQFVAWLFPTPQYHRLHGAALTIPEVNGYDADEVVREVAQHMGGSTETVPLRDWLADNWERVGNAFAAISDAFRWRMIESANAKFSAASYRLRGDAESLTQRLDERSCVAPDDLADSERSDGYFACRSWFDEPAAVEPQQPALPLKSHAVPVIGRPVLGRILIAADRVRVESGNPAWYQALRAKFEKCAGRLVEFVGERVDDLGARLLQGQKKPDLMLVPPRILERAPSIVLTSSELPDTYSDMSLPEAQARAKRQTLESFLDEPIPMLDGRTPRQAANDPTWRPAVVRLMKTYVRHQDEENLRTGGREDLNWMVRELGLTEILFNPPPPRVKPRQLDVADDEAEADEQLAQPSGRLSQLEARERLRRVLDDFPDVELMLDDFEAEAEELMDWLDAVAGKRLNDDEWGFLLVIAAQVWFVYFPGAFDSAAWNMDTFQIAVREDIKALDKILPENALGEFQAHLLTCRQPELLGLLAEQITLASTKGPRKHRLRPEAVLNMLHLTKLIVDGLDRVVRG